MVSSYRLYTLVKYHKKKVRTKIEDIFRYPLIVSGLLFKIKPKMEGFLFEIHPFFLEEFNHVIH